MPRQRPQGAARVARPVRGDQPSDDEGGDAPGDDALQPRLATRSGRPAGGGVVYASADARQGTPKKAKIAAMEGRTIYRRRDGGRRGGERGLFEGLAEFFLSPLPADVRLKVRRAARDFQAGVDAFLQRLGGGGPPALPAPPGRRG
jgi:hypothetical protein